MLIYVHEIVALVTSIIKLADIMHMVKECVIGVHYFGYIGEIHKKGNVNEAIILAMYELMRLWKLFY